MKNHNLPNKTRFKSKLTPTLLKIFKKPFTLAMQQFCNIISPILPLYYYFHDLLFLYFTDASGFFPIKITGPTPPPVPCADSLCNGKTDGNHEYTDPVTYRKNPHYFVQCSSGVASCQACWPSSLVFKRECNQCLYTREGNYNTTLSGKALSKC